MAKPVPFVLLLGLFLVAIVGAQLPDGEQNKSTIQEVIDSAKPDENDIAESVTGTLVSKNNIAEQEENVEPNTEEPNDIQDTDNENVLPVTENEVIEDQTVTEESKDTSTSDIIDKEDDVNIKENKTTIIGNAAVALLPEDDTETINPEPEVIYPDYDPSIDYSTNDFSPDYILPEGMNTPGHFFPGTPEGHVIDMNYDYLTDSNLDVHPDYSYDYDHHHVPGPFKDSMPNPIFQAGAEVPMDGPMDDAVNLMDASDAQGVVPPAIIFEAMPDYDSMHAVEPVNGEHFDTNIPNDDLSSFADDSVLPPNSPFEEPATLSNTVLPFQVDDQPSATQNTGFSIIGVFPEPDVNMLIAEQPGVQPINKPYLEIPDDLEPTNNMPELTNVNHINSNDMIPIESPDTETESDVTIKLNFSGEAAYVNGEPFSIKKPSSIILFFDKILQSVKKSREDADHAKFVANTRPFYGSPKFSYIERAYEPSPYETEPDYYDGGFPFDEPEYSDYDATFDFMPVNPFFATMRNRFLENKFNRMRSVNRYPFRPYPRPRSFYPFF